jgi:hypothetical protein
MGVGFHESSSEGYVERMEGDCRVTGGVRRTQQVKASTSSFEGFVEAQFSVLK